MNFNVLNKPEEVLLSEGSDMTLFQINTYDYGESYIRAYAWAKDKEEAEQLFAARNPFVKIRNIFPLFSDDIAGFCTNTTDHGFPIIGGSLHLY